MAVTEAPLDDLSPSQCRRVGEVLARVGDKWTVLVINELGEGLRSSSGASVTAMCLSTRNVPS